MNFLFYMYCDQIYIRFFQHTFFKPNSFCKSNTSVQSKSVVNPDEVSKGVLLSNLKPYSVYTINIVAHTILPGLSRDYFVETLEAGKRRDFVFNFLFIAILSRSVKRRTTVGFNCN